ncbi:MAG TPA: HD domain-containing phosphohydrolase [Pyrinomonadaceae bacterium]|nr:HD domain-containing phosphohydrolase [Pyrinomonadaceae bacterium]
MSHKIMVVDDEPANLRLLERLLRRDYRVLTAASGQEALQLLEQHDVALLITDQRMPGMTGIELLQRTAEFRPHMVRIVLTGYTDIGALVEAINCGQVYKYITKPWNNDDLRITVERAVAHHEANKSRHELELANRRLSVRLQEMTRAVVRSISDALEAKDEHVHGHARRVSGYAVAVGRRMRLDTSTLEQIALAAVLHDVGKIGTPDALLLKPTPLTDDERRCMQAHSERGARMLAGVPEMEDVAAIVRHHHEQWDGTGYPEGLAGEMIPLASRIIHVADAYDAMTSPRPFRDKLDHEEAVAKLRELAGAHFDAEVVHAFCGLEALAMIRRGVAEAACGEAAWLSPGAHVNAARLSRADLLGQFMCEPALAARALREANFERGGVPTPNIEAACARLGEDRLRAILSKSVGRNSHGVDDAQFKEHSLRCAVAARLLAEQTGLLVPDEAYAVGLLHDIGELLLRSLFPEEMENIVWLGEDARVEREVAGFGVDHAQIGEWILEAAGLPRTLGAAIQTHHDAMRINAPAALLLHMANVIASAESPTEITALDALGSDRLAMLKLSRADLARIHERTAETVEGRWIVTV